MNSELLVKQKIALENRFHAPMNRFFKNYLEVFTAYYSESGIIVNANDFKNELTEIVRTQYRLANRKFGHRMRYELARKKDLTNQQIDQEQENHILEGAALMVLFMLNTTQEIAEKAVKRAIDFFHKRGIMDPTTLQIATQARTEIKYRNASRVPLIANTVTQNAAEGSRFIEFNGVSGRIIGPAAAAGVLAMTMYKPGKSWRTTMDGREREAHAIANGQTVGAKENFTVMGQLLRFPGDISLGATAENVCNCRCTVEYKIVRV